MTFKRGDKVWWINPHGGHRLAAVVLRDAAFRDSYPSSFYVRLEARDGWAWEPDLSPRTEHVPELDQEEQIDG